MNKFLLVIIFSLCLCPTSMALVEYTYCDGSYSKSYSFDGNGNPEYPNQGYIYASTNAYTTSTSCTRGSVGHVETEIYDTNGNTVNYSFSGYGSSAVYSPCAGQSGGFMKVRSGASGLYTATYYIDGIGSDSVTASWETSTSANLFTETKSYQEYLLCYGTRTASGHCTLTISTTQLYSINGSTDCLNYVELSTKNNIIGKQYFNTTHKNYNFTDILIEGFTYNLTFSNSYVYQFTCETSDIEYDYDGCTHTKYRFVELCANLIPDSEGLYIEKQGAVVLAITNFYEASGILDISNSSANHIYIYTDTFIGKTAWVIDPVVTDTEYTLVNPNIAWGLKVIVQNESDGALIDDAMVKVDQTCYCTSGYSTRQKTTVNGMCEFGDMSLQDASLFVMKSGYKICDENSTGYDVFLSGRTNFSSKTWVVKLAPSDSENVSTFYESGNKVDIHFRDVNGNRTSQILDTDSEVYLYYENNNTNEEAMTLKFQSSSTHSYFSDDLSWTISHDDIGHKTIANSYFTPWDYSYRAIIYNSSIYGWNITLPLTVRNATKETTIHYENLTTCLFFIGASDGKIDYREDMKIAAHACSNNTTLMYVDIELYKNNSLLCYKNLTASDFINADFQYWYVWSPIYNYEAGANYSIRMFGFDRTLLETDYIECVADEITRKNKLTIVVKNRFGTNLDNAFVYLEGYGALPTGVNSYASYEGLDDGYYRYKATKAGYDAAGWDDVTLSDGDEIRTYILTETASAAGAANQPQKMEDDDLRNLYVLLMSFLFIFILFGGFLHVIK